MLIPIKCFSCGKLLGDLWNYYIKEKNRLLNEKNKNRKVTLEDINISNEDIMIKHFDDNVSADILDKLEIKNICCRRHFLSTIDLIEFI